MRWLLASWWLAAAVLTFAFLLLLASDRTERESFCDAGMRKWQPLFSPDSDVSDKCYYEMPSGETSCKPGGTLTSQTSITQHPGIALQNCVYGGGGTSSSSSSVVGSSSSSVVGGASPSPSSSSGDGSSSGLGVPVDKYVKSYNSSSAGKYDPLLPPPPYPTNDSYYINNPVGADAILDRRDETKGLYDDMTSLDPSTYRGGFMVVNDAAPGTTVSLRSAELKASIAAQCLGHVQNKRGIQPYDATQWTPFSVRGVAAGWGMLNENYGTRFPTGFSQHKTPVAAFGGPCMWCAKGVGSWIPQTLSTLPWTGSASAPPSAGTRPDLAVVQTSSKLDGKPQVEGHRCYSGKCCSLPSQLHKFPLGVQPNGGMQFLWKDEASTRAHVTYFDPDFKQVGQITFEADDIGGIVAFDTGTVVLVSQMDCDAPMTIDANTGEAKAVVICWDKGKLLWAKRLTDPYRKTPTTEEYKEDPTGNGDYVGKLGCAQVAYSSHDDTVAVYFRVTGGALADGGSHWGANVYVLRRDTGEVARQSFACSHDMGGKMVAVSSAKSGFFHLCLDDGYGLNRTATYGERVQVSKESTVVRAGRSGAFTGSLVRRPNDGGFFLAMLSKAGKVFYDLYVLEFDANTNYTGRRIAFLEDPGYEKFNFHMVPMVPAGTAAGREAYLMSWEVLDTGGCKTEIEGDLNFGPGGVKEIRFRAVAFRDGKFEPIAPDLTTTDLGKRMSPEDQPVRLSDASVAWATVTGSTVVLNRVPALSA